MSDDDDRYRSLLEQAPFSIQVFSPDGRTIRVNEAFEKLWGVRFEDMRGYNVLEDPQLEQSGAAAYIRRAFAGETVRVPAIQYNPNETIPGISPIDDPRRWLSAVIFPVTAAGGEIREVVIIHEDITARVHAEDERNTSEQLLRNVLESIGDAFYAVDRDWRFTYVNPQAEQVVGLPPEKLLGKIVWEEYPGLIGSEFERCFRKVATERVTSSMVDYYPDHDRWYEVHVYPAPGGGISVYVQNVTERKKSEVDLARVTLELREADRRKDEFLATLAHELRNPLAPIRNSLEVLKMPRIDANTSRQAREMMERQIHHLVRLVDDLLDVSRVMRGKIDLRRERIELATVIARAVETCQPLIDAQRHRLEISSANEAMPLDADPVRLAQVVGNLLTNAAKYTPPGGRIWLGAKRDGDHAVLTVRDSGVGIDGSLLPHVFDLFVQGHHTASHSQGGLGVGLTLVRRLVEMHDGTVDASSAGAGKGTEITVRFPLVAGAAEAAAASDEVEAAPGAESSGLRLLVVDDNEDAAVSLALLLELQGHQVRIAHDGPSSLEIAAAYRPDLVFLDIGMPGMDGYEVARRMREEPALEGVVLTAVTGWGQLEDRRRTSEAGFDHHIVKPPEPRLLERLLANLARSRHNGADRGSGDGAKA